MKKFQVCVFAFFTVSYQPLSAQALTPAQTAGACAGYHAFWMLLRDRAGGPNARSDAIFSDQVHRQLSAKWSGDPSFTNASSTAISILNQAFRENNGDTVRVFAQYCASIGVPAGKNTK